MKSKGTSKRRRAHRRKVTAKFLNSALLIDRKVACRSREFRRYADGMCRRIYKDSPLLGKKKKVRTFVRSLLSNLWYVDKQTRCLAVSMSAGDYSKKGKFKGVYISYRALRAAIQYLKKERLIRLKPGYSSKGGGRYTRIWPRLKLRMVFRRLGARHSELEINQVLPKSALILLRDKDRRLLPFKYTPELRVQRDRLYQYNQLILQTVLSVSDEGIRNYKQTQGTSVRLHWSADALTISGAISPIIHDTAPSLGDSFVAYLAQSPTVSGTLGSMDTNPTQWTTPSVQGRGALSSITRNNLDGLSADDIRAILAVERPEKNQLHRIFCRSFDFDRGGRFYGAAYQSLPNELRPYVLINGKPSVELDYNCFHCRMTYHRLKAQCPPAAYIFEEGTPLRELVKLAVNIAINATTLKKTLWTVAAHCEEPQRRPTKRKRRKKAKKIKPNPMFREALLTSQFATPIGAPTVYESVKSLFAFVCRLHSPIQHTFHTDLGVVLQYIDSTIAADILWHFTQRGVPLLCVHDSFVIEAQYESELYALMMQLYRDRLDFDPLIKKK